MDSYKERLQRLFSGNRLDAMIIANGKGKDPNFSYLTEFTSGVFESDILIAQKDKMTLYTSSLEYQTALSQRQEGMRIVLVRGRRALVKDLQRKLKGKVVGFNGSFLPYARYGLLKKAICAGRLIDVSHELGVARSVKSEDEIRKIRRAVGITKGAFGGISDYFKAGMRERELAARFDYLMQEAGSEGMAFSTVLAFGSNAALPHHSPGSSRLRENSFVLIDAGARYGNYCADLTRTFIFRPNKRSAKYSRMVEMLDIVGRAQKAALMKIKEGVDGSTIHMAAQKVIDKSAGGKYRGRLIHALGHSLGIEVHDGTVGLSPNLHVRLKEGMVITDEPGIYVPGFGGVRIEDDVIVRRGRGELI